jgi:hypothetical protein
MTMEKKLDREKAAKILMMLTSDQPGEVTAAAGRLVAMLKAVDMTPADLLLTPDDTDDTDDTDARRPDDLALRRAHAEAEHLRRKFSGREHGTKKCSKSATMHWRGCMSWKMSLNPCCLSLTGWRWPRRIEGQIDAALMLITGRLWNISRIPIS